MTEKSRILNEEQSYRGDFERLISFMKEERR